jgi:hypothetical protein
MFNVGFNNNYVIASWPSSSISAAYGIDSPLERHHLGLAFSLLRQEEHNFTKNLSLEELSHFRKVVTECVLATDLAKGMAWLATARSAFIQNDDSRSGMSLRGTLFATESKQNVDEKQFQEKKLLKMQLIVKCCDVGHPARLFALHIRWSRRICEEFFRQGDIEASKGMKISPLCDRNVPSTTYPAGQIGFINFVSRPLYSLLSHIVKSTDFKPWMNNLDSNQAHWEDLKSKDRTDSVIFGNSPKMGRGDVSLTSVNSSVGSV